MSTNALKLHVSPYDPNITIIHAHVSTLSFYHNYLIVYDNTMIQSIITKLHFYFHAKIAILLYHHKTYKVSR